MIKKFIEEEEVKVFPKKYYFLLGGILIFLFLVILFYFFHSTFSLVSVPSCGDGTFDGSCSLKKPYFCEDNLLIRKPSLCGCSDSYNLIGEECVSEYGNLNETYTFEYSFEIKSGDLSFDYYPEVLDYLLDLSRTKSYRENEIPRRDDFKLAKINNKIQEEFLIPLVVQIQNEFPDSKDMQAKLAIKLVQSISYEDSESVTFFGGNEIKVSRYPYQVLSELKGSCEGKSELLVFLLRELGFGTTLFYYPLENHEAVGIKCPLEDSYKGTGYCFVETTMPSPISYSDGIYLGLGGQGKLLTAPEIILINEGISLGEIDDYEDSRDLKKLVEKIDSSGELNLFQKKRMDGLREKYGLVY